LRVLTEDFSFSYLQIKEKVTVITITLLLFFSDEEKKKRWPHHKWRDAKVQGRRGTSRLYTLAPLAARSLPLPSFLFFLDFQNTANATQGVVVGVLVDKP
jgi:hypothetical protein